VWHIDSNKNIGQHGKDGSWVPKYRYDNVFGPQVGAHDCDWIEHQQAQTCVVHHQGRSSITGLGIGRANLISTGSFCTLL
jgi:hypothetical protein